jgi:phosphate transport system protein
VRASIAAEVAGAVARMCQDVRRALGEALGALERGDLEAARAVMAGDAAIDRQEEAIERLCLRLLGGRHHGGAEEGEVRAVAAAYKVVTDLERVGDHAAAIARSTLRMQGERPIPPFIDIQRMASLASEMVDGSVAALLAADAAAAEEIALRDDAVDALYDQVFRELLTYMLDDRQAVRQATHLLFVANALERIADHATNICEWVIFAATGRRVELND